MDAELLGGLAGIILSLAFAYIPGIRNRYDPLPNATKQAIMGALIVVAALGTFGASCAGIVDVGLTCDKAGAIGLLGVMFSTLIGNQAMFPLTKRDKSADD